MIARAALLLAVPALLLAPAPGAPVAPSQGPGGRLAVQATIVTASPPGTKGWLIAAVTNDSPVTATNLQVELLAACCAPALTVRVPALAAGETRVLREAVDGVTGGRVVVTYRDVGGEHATITSVEPAAAAPARPAAPVNPLWAALVGLLGVAVGGWLAHFFTKRREQEKYAFEWKKMLYEGSAPHFATFLAHWDTSTSVDLLDAQFQELQEKVVVPAAVVAEYRATRAALKSPVGEPEKAAATLRLHHAVETYLSQLPVST